MYNSSSLYSFASSSSESSKILRTFFVELLLSGRNSTIDTAYLITTGASFLPSFLEVRELIGGRTLSLGGSFLGGIGRFSLGGPINKLIGGGP